MLPVTLGLGLVFAGVPGVSGKSTGNDSAREGGALVRAYQCSACHVVNGKGAEGGVSLDNLHRSKNFIVEQLLNPEDHVANNPRAFANYSNLMPDNGLTREEAQSIADYLLSKDHKRQAKSKTKNAQAHPPKRK